MQKIDSAEGNCSVNVVEVGNKICWKAPIISRIDIKRTLTGVGSNSDFKRGNASNSLTQ
jgi:hypothetical protein